MKTLILDFMQTRALEIHKAVPDLVEMSFAEDPARLVLVVSKPTVISFTHKDTVITPEIIVKKKERKKKEVKKETKPVKQAKQTKKDKAIVVLEDGGKPVSSDFIIDQEVNDKGLPKNAVLTGAEQAAQEENEDVVLPYVDKSLENLGIRETLLPREDIAKDKKAFEQFQKRHGKK